jgi:Rieske Fe-S protein
MSTGGEVIPTGGQAPSGGAPVSIAGSSVSTGGTSSNPFFNGGSSSGGNPFATAGSSGDPAGASSGGTGVVAAGGSAVVTGPANPGMVVANLSSVAVGSFQIAGGLFFLGRDAAGLYAMSMQCTHKFCALVIAGTQLDCPCHHSRFDFSGNVLVGPATEPLPYFKVYVDAAGNISVDKFAIVSRTTRVPV